MKRLILGLFLLFGFSKTSALNYEVAKILDKIHVPPYINLAPLVAGLLCAQVAWGSFEGAIRNIQRPYWFGTHAFICACSLRFAYKGMQLANII